MLSVKRTQLQRMHITSECVRALSVRKRTPRRRSPFETPVATTITSPGARSSGGEDTVDVVDPVLGRGLDLGAGGRPELGLQLAAEAAERRGGEDGLPRAADPDREVVVRAADRGGDRRGHVAVLDQLDPGAGAADLLDQVVVARAGRARAR